MLQSSLILCLLPKTTTSGKNGHSVQLLREVTLPGLHTATSWACCDEGKIFLSWERQNCRRSQTSATQDVSSKLIWLSSAIFCTNTPSVPRLRNVLPVNQIQWILHREIAVPLPSTWPQSSLMASHESQTKLQGLLLTALSDHRMGKRQQSPWWSSAELLAAQAAVSYNV